MKSIFTYILLIGCFMKAYSQDINLISKEQAIADIDSLVYTISEVHPEMFTVCKQGEFLKMVSEIQEALPDSVSAWEMYVRLQPLVVRIGDGHTSLSFPFNDVIKENTPRLPMNMIVDTDNKVKVAYSVDNRIPAESEIVKINGITINEMYKKMLCYESGESEARKMNRINEGFSALFFILYSSDTYNVEYIEPGRNKVSRIELKACTSKELIEWRKKTQSAVSQPNAVPYSFKIIPEKNVAIMDFKSFVDSKYMETFSDSMFTTLKQNNIKNLVIDVRENGGGNSQVGDVLLSYISPKPFCQFHKFLARVTPTTQRLMRGHLDTGWYYGEISEKEFVQPKSYTEGLYNGNVILLTSNHTFSSASSFAWAFKEFDMGKVVGEETGGMNVSFGDVVYYKMPYSGLAASISHKRFWQYGADENNIHGTIPDYIVPKEDALSKALELCGHN